MEVTDKTAVVACMDGRIDAALFSGAAHVIRTAGGVVTDDVIRSLAISQHMGGTDEIVLVHHTDCALMKFTDAELVEQLGERPAWSPRTFDDLDESVRDSVERIRSSPFIKAKDSIRGYVYEVDGGELREFSP